MMEDTSVTSILHGGRSGFTETVLQQDLQSQSKRDAFSNRRSMIDG